MLLTGWTSEVSENQEDAFKKMLLRKRIQEVSFEHSPGQFREVSFKK